MENMVIPLLLLCAIEMMIIGYLHHQVYTLRKRPSVDNTTKEADLCPVLPVLPDTQSWSPAEEPQEYKVTLPTNVPSYNHVLNEYDRQFLERLRVTIREDMVYGKVDIEALADKMCISRSQLNRRVKALTGMSTSNYSVQLRLMYACELLAGEPETSVNAVAMRCGFDDAAYFARIFKQRIGMPPSTFRKNKNAIKQLKAITDEQRKAI